MCEIIGYLHAVLHTQEPVISLRIAPSSRDIAEQEELVVYPHIAVNEPHIRQVEYSPVDTDVAFTVVVGLGSRPLHDYLRGMVYLRKRQYTSRVVVVTVAEYHRIHRGQVDPEDLRILHDSVGLSCVEQQPVLLSLNVNGQPVLGDTVLVSAGILNKRYDFHQ